MAAVHHNPYLRRCITYTKCADSPDHVRCVVRVNADDLSPRQTWNLRNASRSLNSCDRAAQSVLEACLPASGLHHRGRTTIYDTCLQFVALNPAPTFLNTQLLPGSKWDCGRPGFQLPVCRAKMRSGCAVLRVGGSLL